MLVGRPSDAHPPTADDQQQEEVREIPLGQAKLQVGPSPDYVRGSDVLDRAFWLQTIGNMLRRLYSVALTDKEETIEDKEETIEDKSVKKNAADEIDEQIEKEYQNEKKDDKENRVASHQFANRKSPNRKSSRFHKIEAKVQEVMTVLQGRDWTQEELEWLFRLLDDIIKSGGVEIGDGTIIIDGVEYNIKDLIGMCCPIG